MALWGPLTWKLLHTLSAKIIDSKFQAAKEDIFTIIYAICSSLPCPICRTHATTYIKNNNMNRITNKQELTNFLFIFHNTVNGRLNKAPHKLSDVVVSASLQTTFAAFMHHYTHNRTDDLSYSFQRRLNLKSIMKLMIKHTNNFYD